jgi:hypothetical protein
MPVRCWDPRQRRYLQVPEANCNPWSEGITHAKAEVENFNISKYILQYLATRFICSSNSRVVSFYRIFFII